MHLLDATDKFGKYREFKVKARSAQGDDLNLRYFAAFMRDKDIEQVSIDDIVEYLGWMKKIGLNPNTVLKKSVSLRKFFEYYENSGFPVINHNLIPLWSKQFSMPRIANVNDYEIFLSTIPDPSPHYWHLRNKALILMQGGCGARVSEMCALNISHLNDDLGGAVIATAKSKGRCPFRKILWKRDPRATEFLRRWLEEREKLSREIEFEDEDVLFIGCKKNYRGLVPPMKRLSEKSMTEWYRKYSVMSGLPYVFNSHSLRHRFGRDICIATKGNNAIISSMLGHASLQSSYTYTRLYGSDIDEQYQNLMDARPAID